MEEERSIFFSFKLVSFFFFSFFLSFVKVKFEMRNLLEIRVDGICRTIKGFSSDSFFEKNFMSIASQDISR